MYTCTEKKRTKRETVLCNERRAAGSRSYVGAGAKVDQVPGAVDQP